MSSAAHEGATEYGGGEPLRFGKPLRFRVGLDVGSTTVKGVVADAASDAILWRDYRRHDTRQAETVLDFLQRMEAEAGIGAGNCAAFITGSGGGALAELIGAKHVQEVNALALATIKLEPGASSVVELGGQDAKMVLFREDKHGHRCAGGTGAVIDKMAAKLMLDEEALRGQRFRGVRIHPVAGRCGVFAETDIIGLQKQGVPAGELMASLFEAIVLQNLTVLMRGHTLRPQVLLLGGPNRFLPGLREAWQHHLMLLWKERGVELSDEDAEQLIYCPEDALHYAALGAIEFGKNEAAETGRYLGTERLAQAIAADRTQSANGGGGLVGSEEERREFEAKYRPPSFVPATLRSGEVVEAFVGLDGGSTSTKAVLLSKDGEVLFKAYRISQGNPVQAAIELLGELRRQVEKQGATLRVLGAATTGYAKEILRRVLRVDAALVETVAHTESALRYQRDVQVVVDVGGQDIKLITLRDGRVRDFKLNSQCSAGNGYFLQATAEGLGIAVDQYAETAFTARRMPAFVQGCAVFLQSDIVNFQRQGWKAEEILAGLATVLPKNVFLHVAKVPSMAALGRRFVLQGGTQKNPAVVKAEVDFLQQSFRGEDCEPEIVVHPHAAEAGAIGAGLEAIRQWREGRMTTFIGMDAVAGLRFHTRSGEETRCGLCKNRCVRTFVEVNVEGEEERIILAGCEKGTVEDIATARGIHERMKAVEEANPNLVEWAAQAAFQPRRPEIIAERPRRWAWTARGQRRRRREQLRVGVPRVLNLFAYAPLFNGYLESLGVRAENIVYSAVTTAEMYRAGSSRGAIDPCYPSKLALAHMHDLLFCAHTERRLDAIFFPMFDVLASPLVGVRANNACPSAAVTPETVEAAYTKERDLFAERGIRYVHPLLDVSDHRLFARQMLAAWGELLGLSAEENEQAVETGFAELAKFEGELRRRGGEVLDQLEAEGRIGIVLLGRPYHHDSGINHGIPEQLQRLGYPVLPQSALPMDEETLRRWFGEAEENGHPLDISDVWKTAFSTSSNHKLWAAKFVARHPNLVAVEFSNFKCGHDAPIYSVIERILESSGTPHFSFKDMDENNPANSMRLRVETIEYFLKLHERGLQQRKDAGGCARLTE